jgi:hypothetical protein
MTPLGKPLVFYLKYMAEMNHLYCDLEEGEERDLTGLDDAEQVLKMARSLGDASCEQVADFLARCAKGIEDYLIRLEIATLSCKSRRSTVMNYWLWRAEVNISSVPGGSFWCGVFVSAPPEVRISMENDACGIVVPYLWSKDGIKGEDAVLHILGDLPNSRAGEWFFNGRGTVALACIPIKPQPPESFDVDGDELIAQVMKTITRIGAEEMKAIANFVADLKESEED